MGVGPEKPRQSIYGAVALDVRVLFATSNALLHNDSGKQPRRRLFQQRIATLHNEAGVLVSGT
jgi:hypothetical protein